MSPTEGEPLRREQALADGETALAQQEAALRSMDEALQERAGALDLVRIELESHNVELREANEALVLATLKESALREEAQLARRRQDEFLAMLAHELRNPLAPLRTDVAMLYRLVGQPIPASLLDRMHRQVEHMVRLIEDLLDVSRVTQGKVTLQRRPTRVGEIVDEAVEMCRERIAAKEQQLSVECHPASLAVDADPLRLVQVMTNLLQNASKYTQTEGKLQIDARQRGSDVQISVRDDGAGISAAALPYIFDLFAQDKRALHRAEGGLGIGLTVVRRMVELHGGTVEARSDGAGQGSEFTVTLPAVEMQDAHESVPPAAISVAPTQARILVVEDNPEAAETLAEFLRACGHGVDVAADGLSGVELFDDLRPQVVLCDIGLPGIDGYEVAARIRKNTDEPRPALIAITGYGGVLNAERALAAGFDHHLVKPVDPDALIRLIDSALRRAA